MCLLTIEKEPTVLREDLIVYKIMRVYRKNSEIINFGSYFYAFNWKPGVLYHTEFRSSKQGVPFNGKAERAYIKNGFVASSNMNKAIHKDGKWISDGFHWIENDVVPDSDLFHYDLTANIVKCIVPAGAKVYRDVSGLGVSDKLIAVEVVSRDCIR